MSVMRRILRGGGRERGLGCAFVHTATSLRMTIRREVLGTVSRNDIYALRGDACVCVCLN